MPAIPAISAAPYDSITSVLKLARTYVQDASGPNGLAGDLLANSVPTTVVYLNSAFRRLQDELLDSGVETLAKEVVIPNFPAVALRDPSINVWIDWEHCFDGVNVLNSPVVPFDMVLPWKMWQRPAGQAMFEPLDPCPIGLPNQYQGSLMLGWEWRSDKIYMNGATNEVDLKLRYSAYYADLDLDNPDTDVIPVMRSGRAMGYLVAAEYAAGRGGVDAQNLEAQAMKEIDKITARTAARKQQVIYRRQPRRY